MDSSSNQKLISYLQKQGLLDDKLKKAFLSADRAKFVPENLAFYAYQDSAMPLFERQTISQPSVVAFMLRLLDVQKGDRILDVGAGSGWVSSLLANLAGKEGKIYAFEINKKIGKFGKENIKKTKVENINYYIEDASKKWSEFIPYDRIHSGAGFDEITEELKDLLKINGILVVPTQDGNIRKIIRKGKEDFKEEIFPGFVFVPFVDKSN